MPAYKKETAGRPAASYDGSCQPFCHCPTCLPLPYTAPFCSACTIRSRMMFQQDSRSLRSHQSMPMHERATSPKQRTYCSLECGTDREAHQTTAWIKQAAMTASNWHIHHLLEVHLYFVYTPVVKTSSSSIRSSIHIIRITINCKWCAGQRCRTILSIEYYLLNRTSLSSGNSYS